MGSREPGVGESPELVERVYSRPTNLNRLCALRVTGTQIFTFGESISPALLAIG